MRIDNLQTKRIFNISVNADRYRFIEFQDTEYISILNRDYLIIINFFTGELYMTIKNNRKYIILKLNDLKI